jgi:chorismate--pyruvate lyase
MHGWLSRPGSLTAHLRRHCAAFNVVRLRQGPGRPHLDECEPLHLSRPQTVLVREVLLRCGDRPLVFAHSVTLRDSLAGPWRALAGLGNRPLGEALFLNPRIIREPLCYRRIDARHPLYRAAAAAIPEAPRWLWARRARYLLDGAPLLVSEVFLPELV